MSQQLNSIYKHPYVRPPSVQLFIDHWSKNLHLSASHATVITANFLFLSVIRNLPFFFLPESRDSHLAAPTLFPLPLDILFPSPPFPSFVLITVRSPRPAHTNIRTNDFLPTKCRHTIWSWTHYLPFLIQFAPSVFLSVDFFSHILFPHQLYR